MNARSFDIGIGCGLACVTAGAFMAWGAAVALMVCGSLVLALTIFSVSVGGVR